MHVTCERGIYLPEADLWLDARASRPLCVVSHAHSDHVARHDTAILTAPTLDLLPRRVRPRRAVVMEWGEAFPVAGGHRITLLPSAHCLGSAQVLVEHVPTGRRLLYTGDVKTWHNPTAVATALVPCDTLVIESTFGRPHYRFPPQAQVLDRLFGILRGWLSQGLVPVVQGYRLGKAQEVLWHLLSAGFEVAVEESVFRICEVYSRHGVAFPGRLRVFDDVPREGEVLLLPPGVRRRMGLERLPGVRTVALTGWAVDGRRWQRADVLLPFSDHADFPSLVGYVQTVAPRRVLTVNGFPDLAVHLRRLGYHAGHLNGAVPSPVQLPLF